MRSILIVVTCFMINSCNGQMKSIQTGADQTGRYLHLLSGNIAIVSNQTTEVDGTHLVDTLLSLQNNQFKIQKIFAPEHGFRGTIDDGVEVKDEVDVRTGLQVESLYGKNKKPSREDLEEIDLVIFDIQDVGARFYTFISTMHYVMEACAESEVKLMVLDRPNPNGNYFDGPILDTGFRSFVGMHPIPVVHGMTIGELALMINGEGWLKNRVQCSLTVIPCLNYSHQSEYALPVRPSPNLPYDQTIKLYPSTCFFEGTIISEGRGTAHPFQVYGHPDLPGEYSFVPESIEGMEMNPKLTGRRCYGRDLRDFNPEGGWNKIELRWIIEAYTNFPDKDVFFTDFFDLLAGTDQLRKQILNGWSEQEIRASWKDGLKDYSAIREKYLLYDP
ncbi:MAG: DUF1343 domain-containing protein [Bacteroidales bacterium]|nr:DUF1343 domain-containing protein [Bacteroidales bacterium]